MKNERRYNVIYWIAYFILIALIESGPEHKYFEAFSSNFITLPVKIAFVLLVTEYLMPYFLFKKQIRAFLALYFPLLVAFAVLLRLADNEIIIEYVLTEWAKEPLISPPPFLYNLIKLQFALAFPLSIKMFLHWNDMQNKAIEINNEKMQAELNFLRSQFHPHFMFNALNSLYAKIVAKSDVSGDMILKLSSLLRFSIYEAKEAFVTLVREVEYIQHYIDLQRIRFEDSVDISFTVHGDLSNKNIEPFLILPFIENSFKYCQGSDDAWVTIQLNIEDNWLTVRIDNSKGNMSVMMQEDELHSRGVGQENVRKRLKLLYEGRYTLRLSDGEDSYFVFLRIKLN